MIEGRDVDGARIGQWEYLNATPFLRAGFA